MFQIRKTDNGNYAIIGNEKTIYINVDGELLSIVNDAQWARENIDSPSINISDTHNNICISEENISKLCKRFKKENELYDKALEEFNILKERALKLLSPFGIKDINIDAFYILSYFVPGIFNGTKFDIYEADEYAPDRVWYDFNIEFHPRFEDGILGMDIKKIHSEKDYHTSDGSHIKEVSKMLASLIEILEAYKRASK